MNYFVYPFGTAGDITAVPLTAAPAVLSYQYGFGVDFELPLDTNPNALPIPRSQFNQLMFDITSAVQQYQQTGTPNFILAADNLGVAFPYPIYARVRYLGEVYENQVASNTATPGTDTTWTLISGGVDGIRTGTILDFAGVAVPSGYLACDGASQLRASYGALVTALTTVQSGVVTSGSAVITSLPDTSKLYVGEPVEGAGIAPSSAILSIDSSTQITLNNNATASSTTNLTFWPWGNGNGSTTFTVPNFVDNVAAGAGGTLLAAAGKSGVGLSGGAANHTLTISEMPAHNHPGSTAPVGLNYSAPRSPYLLGNDQNGFANNAITVASQGGGTAFPIVQPTKLVNKIIKT